MEVRTGSSPVRAPSEAMKRGSLSSDVRGASRLAVDLTMLVTTVVETMHHNIARHPAMFGRATHEPAGGLTGVVYGSVRGITRLVGAGIDAALAPLMPLLDRAADWQGRETVVAALNGVLGDYLDETANSLAIPMRLRLDGQPLELSSAKIAAAIARPRERVVVLIHGLCMSDLQWDRRSHDHGRALARDLRADTLYLHYNSGRHISTNGAELCALLEQLVVQWPVPLEQLILVGHSMGGLVIRSAVAAATKSAHAWPQRVRAIVFLGTPHHGAPLERAGHGVDVLLEASPYTAAFGRLGRLRSAGITDLRHGCVVEPDQPQPLPAGIACFAVAGSASKAAPKHGGVARGDGLVPIASALGRHVDRRWTLDFPQGHRYVAYDTGHLDLLSSAAVYAQMKRWLVDVCR